MKSLDRLLIDMLKEDYKLPDVNGFRTIEEFMDLNGFTPDTLTEDAQQFYFTHNYSRYLCRELVLETLNSVKTELLIQRLEEEFNVTIKPVGHKGTYSDRYAIMVYDMDGMLTDLNSSKTNTLPINKHTKVFYDILDKYKYYISVIRYSKNCECMFLLICPYYGTSLYDKNKYPYRYIYHITHESNVNSIMKQGLLPLCKRVGDEGFYRYFPERVYLVCDEKRKLGEALQKLCVNLGIKYNKKESYHILQINRSKHNIPMYVDDVSDHEGAFYTYNAIPPHIIKDIGTVKYWEEHDWRISEK